MAESLGQLRTRVEGCLRKLVENEAGGRTLLVVGHQLAWASLLAHLRQVPAAKWNKHTLPNARFARLWFHEGAWCVDVDHKPFDGDEAGPESTGAAGS